MKNPIIIAIFIFISILNSVVYANDLEDLEGTFSTILYGEMLEKYRVNKTKNGYTLDEKKAHKTKLVWKDNFKGMPLIKVTKEQFEKMAKIKIKGPLIGLKQKNGFIILKASKGLSIGRFKTKTGYFAITPIGFMELTKK
ncbi:MAG: hypothetical protein KAG20_09100, partial [Cocleimonas sp.]|nr:hypothetical protein [Cocleimonas sp.]